MAITIGSADDRDQQLAEVDAFANRRGGERIVVADSWDSLGLESHGFQPSPYGSVVDWFWRASDSSLGGPAGLPDGMTIEEVRGPEGLAEYERISARGFENEERLESLGTFGIHAQGILDDPRMRTYVGRVDGEPVAGAMAYVTDHVVGVYGVATPPEHRRRGYGEAITRAAVGAAPDLPAWLQPSDMAAPMYRRMGFNKIGRYTAWLRPAAT